MRLRNQIQLIGRLGQDPEHRILDSGTELCRFSLATSESYKNRQGEKVEETQWHTCIAWRALAGIIQKHAAKGMQVAVRGKMTYRNYEKDGIQRTSAEVIVEDFLILDKAEQRQAPTAEPQNSTPTQPPKPAQNNADDGLPF